jgi:glyoxylase-like metal-dependent hydrolase (beta-lactamase superfamily II)
MKIAPGIHRIGDQSIVNAYLLEDAGEVTIIDAGVPGYYRDIPRELAAMGRTVADVRALLLTHGHTDHIGFAEWSWPAFVDRLAMRWVLVIGVAARSRWV